MRVLITLYCIIILSSQAFAKENIPSSIESDKIEYLNDSGDIKALGSVKITRENFQLEADEVSFNQKNNIIKGNGNIIIKEKKWINNFSFQI